MKKIFYLVTLLSIVLLFSCKKYPEGPFITFRSVDRRLNGNWNVVEFTSNGIDSLKSFIDSCGSKMLMDIPHDGYNVMSFKNYMTTFGATFRYADYFETLEVYFGHYNFEGIGPIGSNKGSKWIILKLTNKKFKVSIDFNGRNYIISFEKL